MEKYTVPRLHLENGSATAVIMDIISMDHHIGEYVNLTVPGVETNLPVKVSVSLSGIT